MCGGFNYIANLALLPMTKPMAKERDRAKFVKYSAAIFSNLTAYSSFIWFKSIS